MGRKSKWDDDAAKGMTEREREVMRRMWADGWTKRAIYERFYYYSKKRIDEVLRQTGGMRDGEKTTADEMRGFNGTEIREMDGVGESEGEGGKGQVAVSV